MEWTTSSLSDSNDGPAYLFTELQPIQDLTLIISTFQSFGEDKHAHGSHLREPSIETVQIWRSTNALKTMGGGVCSCACEAIWLRFWYC